MLSDRKNKMALWLKYGSIFALLLLPLALLGFRLKLYSFSMVVVLLASSLFIALTIFFMSLVIGVRQRKLNPESAKQINIATYISLLPLLFLGTQIVKAASLPFIHNISSDVIDPPQFNKLVAIRGQDSNPHVYDAQLIAKQQQAYPEIETMVVQQTAQQAYEKSLVIAQSLGWDIINKDPTKGIIEASQTSLLWGFTDDIVVRVSDNNGQTEIDLHSVSRIGRSDFGANAKRIARFFDTYVN